MTQQNTVRLAIILVLLSIAAIVLVTCRSNGAPAAQPTAKVAAPTPEPPAPPVDSTADSTVEAGASGGDSTGSTATGAAVPFMIDQAVSEARFLVNETLLGNPTEVKGVTNLISGTIEIDTGDPAKTAVGPITIDARDLHTDRDLRNRSIRRFILESNKDEYRYITFTPTAIQGLPAQATAGDSFAFQVTGDLKIKDVSKPVTFDVDVKADSGAQISGLAKTTIKRSDFNLSIPSAPGVADVTEEVRLELAFTAKAD